jgi:predicted nuclease of predicted toxin-antitoxin system
MNISPITVEELRNKGWDIARVNEVMDVRNKDTEILAYARELDKVIITHDLDFSLLLAIGGYEKPSVINLRIEDARPESVTRRIMDVVLEMEKELEEGIVVSVDEVSARSRSLPINK